MRGYRFGHLPDRCPFCGREIVYAYWEHYRQCAKARQRELDEEHARETARAAVARYRAGGVTQSERIN